MEEGSSGRSPPLPPPRPRRSQASPRLAREVRRALRSRAAHLQGAPPARMATDGAGKRLRDARQSRDPRQEESCARRGPAP